MACGGDCCDSQTYWACLCAPFIACWWLCCGWQRSNSSHHSSRSSAQQRSNNANWHQEHQQGQQGSFQQQREELQRQQLQLQQQQLEIQRLQQQQLKTQEQVEHSREQQIFQVCFMPGSVIATPPRTLLRSPTLAHNYPSPNIICPFFFFALNPLELHLCCVCCLLSCGAARDGLPCTRARR